MLGYNVGEVERDGDGMDTVTVRLGCITPGHRSSKHKIYKSAVTRRSATGAERKWISTSSLPRADTTQTFDAKDIATAKVTATERVDQRGTTTVAVATTILDRNGTKSDGLTTDGGESDSDVRTATGAHGVTRHCSSGTSSSCLSITMPPRRTVSGQTNGRHST